jgi:hypothetical protein
MRTAQQQLVDIADRSFVSTSVSTDSLPIEEFLPGLRIAWKDGEVRPTALPKPKQKRGRRRPDPLAKVTEQLHTWFTAEPWRTGRELLARLQVEYPASIFSKSRKTTKTAVASVGCGQTYIVNRRHSP